MKKMFFKLTVLAAMMLCCSFLFAEASTELVANIPTSTDNPIVGEFLKELDDYQSEYESLYMDMQSAYEKGDAQSYINAKKSLRNLKPPVLSKEETELALKTIAETNDVQTAQILFQYSPYYRPVLTFEAEETGMNYHSTITVIPGSEITLPTLSASDMTFTGWGTQKGVLSYKAGEKIQMPVVSTVLYAVFEPENI